MSKIIKISAATLIVLLCGTAVRAWVWIPFRQNQVVKAAMYEQAELSVHDSRLLLRTLKNTDLGEPYLQGWSDLSRARLLRKMGRDDEAVSRYKKAIKGRVPVDVWVELGLYELELGRKSDAEAHLRFALDLHVDLRRSISDRRMRDQIEQLLKVEK